MDSVKMEGDLLRCRACLLLKNSYVSLLDEEVGTVYEELTSIKVSRMDQKPKVICNSCNEDLKKFKEFREICLTSEATLDQFEPRDQSICFGLLDVENKPPNEVDIDVKLEDDVLNQWEDLVEEYSSPNLKTKEDIVSEEVANEYQIYHCSDCDKEYVSKKRFENHIQMHQDQAKMPEGAFRCIQCSSKWFKTKNELREHESDVHSSQKRFVCGICKKVFKSRRNLKKHQVAHEIRQRAFICEHCNKSFATKDTLKLHTNIHTREILYICDVCGACFVQRSSLKSHLYVHSEDRPFHCHNCSKAFKTKPSLEKHMVYHISDKNFSCEVCAARFRRKDHLVSHERRHNPNREKIVCSTCGSQFSSKSALKTHQRTHTDERPYQCSLCPLAFRQRQNLKKHQYTHTGTRPFNCPYCPKGYYDKGYLKNHVMTLHGIEITYQQVG